jgi:hypothetical protein
MCDFSLQSVRSRPAKVGDTLVTHNFGTGTRGFAAVDDSELAVCLMSGTELSFAEEVAILPHGLLGWGRKTIGHRTAIFRQINKDKLAAHHDALEFPDGRIELLTLLREGQVATVLQMPVQPKTVTEVQARVAYVD